MNIILKKAICLHAKSSDLLFLNPVKNRLSKILNSSIKCFDLSDQYSNEAALLCIKQLKEGLVIIFAHGCGDYLRGGEYRSRATGENVEIEKFLTKSQFDIFKGKVIFCMSCDSNGLAQSALNAGAHAFVGFDSIPFNRFSEDGNPIGSHVLVKHSQDLLADSVRCTLERFLNGRDTLYANLGYFRLRILKKILIYVRSNFSVKERKEVAALMLITYRGVKYHGVRNVKFVSDKK